MDFMIIYQRLDGCLNVSFSYVKFLLKYIDITKQSNITRIVGGFVWWEQIKTPMEILATMFQITKKMFKR